MASYLSTNVFVVALTLWMKDFLQQNNDSKAVSEFVILDQKGAKIASFKNVDFLFGSMKTIILCIVGELAERGLVAVAVGISDILQVTCDMQNMTGDT